MLLLLVACASPRNPSEPEVSSPSHSVGSPSATTGGALPGDTAAPPVDGDCDPAYGSPGRIEAEAVQPHAEVYGANPAPFAVHLGAPGSDLSVSVAFLWRSDLDTLASAVQLRPQGGEEIVLVGASYQVGTTSPARIHEVKACALLQPGTTYQYRVGGPEAWSETFTFTTPLPPDQVRSVRMVFAGDSRGGYAQWSALVRQIGQLDPDLVVFSGDAVGYGGNQAEWDLWFLAGKGLVERVPVVMAHGNHEAEAENWFALLAWPGDELTFPVRLGPVQLLVLNDIVPTAELGAQVPAIRRVFGESDATWKVALHHQPAWTTSTRHASNLSVRSTWSPVFEEVGVDLVVSGHNHLYERSVPIQGGAETAPGPGVTYLVSGGAGAPIYADTSPEWYGAVVRPTEHFGVVDFTADRADVEVLDAAGNVLDAFTLPAD